MFKFLFTSFHFLFSFTYLFFFFFCLFFVLFCLGVGFLFFFCIILKIQGKRGSCTLKIKDCFHNTLVTVYTTKVRMLVRDRKFTRKLQKFLQCTPV